MVGIQGLTQVANRFEGGYGFSLPALEKVKQSGATLLITCDCGSSDHERIELANQAGIDVIVVDHHLVPEQPLPALAGQTATPLQAPGFVETAAAAGGGLPQAEAGFTLDEILALSDSLKRRGAPRGASARGRYRRPLFRARA